MRGENFDQAKGWENTKPNWYGVIIELDKITGIAKYHEIINWVYDNIDNPDRHARWQLTEYGIFFRFRHERDYIWFKMRWL